MWTCAPSTYLEIALGQVWAPTISISVTTRFASICHSTTFAESDLKNCPNLNHLAPVSETWSMPNVRPLKCQIIQWIATVRLTSCRKCGSVLQVWADSNSSSKEIISPAQLPKVFEVSCWRRWTWTIWLVLSLRRKYRKRRVLINVSAPIDLKVLQARSWTAPKSRWPSCQNLCPRFGTPWKSILMSATTIWHPWVVWGPWLATTLVRSS